MSINIALGFQPPFEPITALFTLTGLWPNDIIPFQTNGKTNPLFQTKKHLKSHDSVYMYVLTSNSSREILATLSSTYSPG